MKNTIFWDITPCSPLKVNRRFGGTYHLHLKVEYAENIPAWKQVANRGEFVSKPQSPIEWIYNTASLVTLAWGGGVGIVYARFCTTYWVITLIFYRCFQYILQALVTEYWLLSMIMKEERRTNNLSTQIVQRYCWTYGFRNRLVASDFFNYVEALRIVGSICWNNMCVSSSSSYFVLMFFAPINNYVMSSNIAQKRICMFL
jgi:hypothetical protein